jgi:hypothetical protein
MASKRQKRQEDRKARSVRYDLEPELKQTIADLAAEYGVPQSQIASLLMEHGLEALRSGEIDIASYLRPSRSPLFDYTLDIDQFKDDQKKK